jgi:hypothetical protein
MPTLTLTVAAGPAARVATAFGARGGLKVELTPEILADTGAIPPVLYQAATYGPRSATMSEITDSVRHFLRSETIKQEYAAKQAALTYDTAPEIT